MFNLDVCLNLDNLQLLFPGRCHLFLWFTLTRIIRDQKATLVHPLADLLGSVGTGTGSRVPAFLSITLSKKINQKFSRQNLSNRIKVGDKDLPSIQKERKKETPH
jgi:hypothetical protein